MATQFVCPNRTPIMGVDFDIPVLHGSGKNLDLDLNSGMVTEFTPLNATGTVTVTNAGAQNDVLRVTIAGINVDTTVGATPTTTTVAAQVAAAINATAALFDKVVATSAAAIVTITATDAGFGGNGVTLAASNVSGTVAATASGTVLAGGTQLITPLDNFSIAIGRQTIQLRSGHPILATPAIASAIIASGYAYN